MKVLIFVNYFIENFLNILVMIHILIQIENSLWTPWVRQPMQFYYKFWRTSFYKSWDQLCNLVWTACSFEYVGHSNAAILSSLKGSPGYEWVQPTSHTEVNTKIKRSSCKIVYDLPDLPWLSDPPVTKGLRAPTQQGEDSFGHWHSSTKTTASDLKP